jgi:hypothetical protein
LCRPRAIPLSVRGKYLETKRWDEINDVECIAQYMGRCLPTHPNFFE